MQSEKEMSKIWPKYVLLGFPFSYSSLPASLAFSFTHLQNFD